MSDRKPPSSAQPPKPDAPDRSDSEALHPHKDLPHGKDFGADDDTPQQGGM